MTNIDTNSIHPSFNLLKLPIIHENVLVLKGYVFSLELRTNMLFKDIVTPKKNPINHLLERRAPKLQGANALRMQVMRHDHIQKIWDFLNLAGTFADLAGKTKIWKRRNLEGKKYIYYIYIWY